QTKPVIAGIDFSAPSNFVLRHAVRLAGFSGVPVIAVHVLDSGRLAHWAASAGGGVAAETILKQAEEKLAALIQEEAAGTQIRNEVRSGRAADELQRAIEENAAGVLVIAANDLSKNRLGSVASRCVRTAPCDVLVLRDWQEGDFEKIVVCTDFSATAGRALERGIALAVANNASLEIVHVMYPPTMDPWGKTLDYAMDSPTPYAEEARTRVQQRMKTFLAPHADPLSAVFHNEVILESSSASAALTDHIRESGADLVVLGTHGLTRIAGLFLGTNAEALLQEATVSVLAVRD
ncbi:MAG: universal stress protein, partial [Akkermansiaceae bacterium]